MCQFCVNYMIVLVRNFSVGRHHERVGLPSGIIQKPNIGQRSVGNGLQRHRPLSIGQIFEDDSYLQLMTVGCFQGW